MATLEATQPNVIDFNHLVPPIIPQVEEEFAEPLTPEEQEQVAIAEAQHARGEYYTKFPGETFEEFFARIDSDPEKWLECNLRKFRQKAPPLFVCNYANMKR